MSLPIMKTYFPTYFSSLSFFMAISKYLAATLFQKPILVNNESADLQTKTLSELSGRTIVNYCISLLQAGLTGGSSFSQPP